MSLDLDACLSAVRIVPVITVPASPNSTALAAPLAEALSEAGITAVEIALRTPGAELMLELMAEHTGLTVGAGTVLTAQQAVRAGDAGASFLVSPGFDESVVAASRDVDVPIIPGVATATELMRALRAGITTVKLFPAEPIGGLATLKALSAPFPGVRFMPTGGIGPEQAADYLSIPQVVAISGSWIAPVDLLERADFQQIRTRAEHAVKLAAA